MATALNVVMIVLLILSAILAVRAKDLLAAVIIFSVYSLIMALVWQRP